MVGRYNSTYDFVSRNNLDKEATDCFGLNWEAEDDCNQIRELLKHIGMAHVMVSFLDGLEEDDILLTKEQLVYVLDYTDISDNHAKLSDEEFISIAETTGKIYSLEGFVSAFNNEDLDVTTEVIRIL